MVISPRLVVFAAVLPLTALSFGAAILIISAPAWSAAPLAVSETPVPVVRVASPPRPQSAVPSPVRVLTATGGAEVAGNGYRVTFAWALEGASVGDPAVVRLFAGGRLVTEQRGVLDASVFSASTGRLTLVTAAECSADGWSAELVSIRNQAIVGEGSIKVPGVVCR